MAKEKLYAKKGLFGTTVYVDRQNKAVGKTVSGSDSGVIRDSRGKIAGKSCGSYGVGFSRDNDRE